MPGMSTGVNRRLTLHPKVDPVTRCIILIVGSGTGKTNRARYSLELKVEAVRLSGAGFDADLGGDVLKKRSPSPGAGKRVEYAHW
jgi:hypothetical protein